MSLKQWELPKNAACRFETGEILYFAGQDGMYGKWKQDPEQSQFEIALFNGSFVQEDDGSYLFYPKEK